MKKWVVLFLSPAVLLIMSSRASVQGFDVKGADIGRIEKMNLALRNNGLEYGKMERGAIVRDYEYGNMIALHLKKKASGGHSNSALSSRGEKSVPPPKSIDINMASEQQLERIPGLGPVRANAIVNYRKANGIFKTKEDLEQVPGIGPTLAESILIYGTLGVAKSVKKDQGAVSPGVPSNGTLGVEKSGKKDQDSVSPGVPSRGTEKPQKDSRKHALYESTSNPATA